MKDYGEVGVVSEDQVCVTFSPQNFKSLVLCLQGTLNAYEQAYGKLEIRDDAVAPIFNATEILERINDAIQQNREARESLRSLPSPKKRAPRRSRASVKE